MSAVPHLDVGSLHILLHMGSRSHSIYTAIAWAPNPKAIAKNALKHGSRQGLHHLHLLL